MADYAGTFLWYEILTDDVDAAKAFYTELIGWSTEEWTPEGGGAPYTMLKVGDAPVGGIMQLPDEAKKQGAPPHWLAHVGVEDVDAASAKVKDLGGTIYAGPMDVPEVGRFTIAADPGGAVFAMFQPGGTVPKQPTEGPGAFVWNELWTDKPDETWAFYEKLFGWKRGDSMDSPNGKYWMFHIGDRMAGGYGTKMPEMPVSFWLYYVHVKDLDAACEQVKARGGKVLHGPMEIPGGDRVAQCMDPEGAAFAIHGK